MKKLYDLTQASHETFDGADTQYRTTSCTFLRAQEFENWQQEFLRIYSKLPADIQWVGSLLLFEAIAKQEDFTEISRNGSVFKSNDVVILQWTATDGRIDSRELSCISYISLATTGNNTTVIGDLNTYIPRLLSAIAPALPQKVEPKSFFVLCAVAWCFIKLPNFLFAHIVGDVPMAALGRSILARRDSKLTLADYFNRAHDEVEEDFSLEGYFHADVFVEKADVLTKMLEKLTSENPHNLTERQLQIETASRLRTLGMEAENAGPVTCLILSHCINMFSTGSHALSSQISYVKNGAPAVLRALSGLGIEQISSDDFAKVYQAGLANLAGENLRKARAYISHFHAYVREWLDIAPLQRTALPEVEPSRIDANVVWQHEVSVLQTHIKLQEKHDPRLAQQTSLVVDLIYACRARGKEIFLLQVRNVRVSNSAVEIEIVTWGRKNGLKSDAAQRVIELTDSALAARVLAWKNLRQGEDAKSSDLLFGSKEEQGRCYRLGLMYPWLNQTIKFSTGDSDSCLHHLRHGSADASFSELKFDANFHEQIDRLIVEMGHASLKSTMKYLHSFAGHIRFCLDLQLKNIQISSANVAALTNVKAAALRKRIQRMRCTLPATDADSHHPTAELTLNSNYWDVIEFHSTTLTSELSVEGMNFCCPFSSAPLKVHRAFNAVDVAWSLLDIQNGHSPAQASRQRRVDQFAFEISCKELLRLGNAAMRAKRESRGIRLTEPRAALTALNIDMSRAWQPKYRSWLSHLSKIEIPEVTDKIWNAWEDAKWGKYIEVSRDLEATAWLGFLSSLKFPSTHLVIKHEVLTVQEKSDLEFCVLLGLGQGVPLTPNLAPRGVGVMHNTDRPKIYLHVANEDEVATDHTGAAFETGGLEAIMLVLRIASVALYGRKE